MTMMIENSSNINLGLFERDVHVGTAPKHSLNPPCKKYISLLCGVGSQIVCDISRVLGNMPVGVHVQN